MAGVPRPRPGRRLRERRLLDRRLPPGARAAGTVVVVTAGTADLPVATECAAVLGALGFGPTLLADCGVAGLHRLLAEVDTIAMADAVVVIAGMEGALASVVGGLTPAPVVAVPTSTGYGAALEGVTALLAMLSACSSGDHRRRHRQRVRRGLRHRPAAAVTATAADTDGGLVPLLRRHRRRHGPGLARRRRRRRRRGPRRCSTASTSRAGTCGSKRAARRRRLHPGGRRAATTWWSAPTARSRALIDARPRCPPRVTERALAVFGSLAAVESALHRRPVDQVHFHEVGGHDAIVDIVGTAAALEVLGVDEVERVGRGDRDAARCAAAHGRLPNPAPATVRLLEGIPTYGRDTRRGADDADRRRAPGGAVLVVRAAARHDDHRVGLRRGRRGDGRPAQLHPGRDRAAGRARQRRPGQPALVLETNLDDVTGEQLGYAVAAALDGRRARRLGEPGHHEEGPPGPRPARADRRRAGRCAPRARSSGSPGTMGVPGHRRRTLARRPARWTQVMVDGDHRAHEGRRRTGQAGVRRRRRRRRARRAHRCTRSPAGPRRPGGRAPAHGPDGTPA